MKDIHIQWHPAFDAALKIELHDYEDILSFESEHLLSKKPMQIDLLIIKKQSHIHIHKNIGHLFKTYNLYQAVMNVILRANREEAEAEKKMCDALRELFADELKESEIRGIEQGTETGEACFAQLTLLLLSDSRMEDLIRATKDKAFRNALYQEYGIKAPLTIKH